MRTWPLSKACIQHKSAGFTLIEMVLSIMISGVIFLGLAGFVEFASRGYMGAVDRQQVQNQAQFVLEKMSRDIQNAAPNSVQVLENHQGQSCLSFNPIVHVGRYERDITQNRLRFVIDNQASRLIATPDIVDWRLILSPQQASDYRLDASNQNRALNEHSVPLASCLEADDSRCWGSKQADGHWIYTLADSFRTHSPIGRYYIYTQPVHYCFARNNQLTKNGVVIGDTIDFTQSRFSYHPETHLVQINLYFSYGDEASFYKHSVVLMHEE